MTPSDRRGVQLVLCFVVGLVAMTVTGLIVRLPNGEYDMGGLGAIALAGLAGTLVSSAILGSALLRKPRRN